MPLLLTLSWLLLEAWIIGRLSTAIGAGLVVLILLAMAVLGVVVIQRQGLRTVREAQQSVARGELPVQPLMDGVMALVAGGLLIIPGFLSDVVALLLLLGSVRRRVARTVTRRMARRRPDLRAPVVIEGEYWEYGDNRRMPPR
jgi:UPF0716 protein FxsA